MIRAILNCIDLFGRELLARISILSKHAPAVILMGFLSFLSFTTDNLMRFLLLCGAGCGTLGLLAFLYGRVLHTRFLVPLRDELLINAAAIGVFVAVAVVSWCGVFGSISFLVSGELRGPIFHEPVCTKLGFPALALISCVGATVIARILWTHPDNFVFLVKYPKERPLRRVQPPRCASSRK